MLIIIPIVLVCAIAATWLTAFVYFKNSNIEKRFNTVVSGKNIHEAVLFVENTAGDFSENYGYGGRDIDSPILIASVTKMFTTTCILILCEGGQLSLDDKISLYINNEILNGLHVYKGVEYSYELTVSDLLFQTSGLGQSDYLDYLSSVIENGDKYITFVESISEVKNQTPRFAPNSGKVLYADTNFDLLGVILEKITELPLEQIYKQFIFEPHEMTNTYLPVGENDFVPHTYYGSERLEIPQLIASSRASGGCVSTARDMMIFSKAFWGGELFDKNVLERLADYDRLLNMPPIQYGGGYMRLPLGGLNTFFLAKGELIGHSGSTGSFVFYYPEKDLHIVGDLAQFANPGAAIRFVMQLAMVI